MLAPTPHNQATRIAALQRYDLGTRTHEGVFDGIVELASQLCRCPIALVSMVHEADQRFEARCGLAAGATGLDASICSHAILQEDILEISDLRLDMRTHDNPLVTDPDDPLLFYAGAQIVTRAGVPLGTLCVFDRRPRRLGDQERRGLRILADQVMQRLELHDALRQQEMLRREVDHRVKNNLANVAVLTRMAARTAASPETRETLASVERRIQVMVELHSELYAQADPSGADQRIDVARYLTRIAGHLRDMAPAGVGVRTAFEPLHLPAHRASALGVLINEMASNAVKHGFPEGRAGTIEIEGVREDARYVLRCRDDGIGGEPDDRGLGMRIMQAAGAQLGGTLTLGPTPSGFEGRVAFASDPR